MANTDKDILITPNRGSTNEPKIEFKGASSSVGPSTITATIYPTNNGTLSFDGTEGSLFSIANNLTTGSIFSVNPISGIPIIDVNADRTIALNPYGGNTGIGLTNPSYKLDVNGTARFSGQLTIPGNNSILFGPNSTWSRYLRIGGNGWAADSTTASVVTTDGNLHLDAADANHGIYLNWYGGTNGTFFGNGATGQIGRLDGSGNFSVSGTITGTQITSNIANGTAPFVVSSTTKVTNLNADYLDDLDSGSFLRSDALDQYEGQVSGRRIIFRMVDNQNAGQDGVGDLAPLEVFQNSNTTNSDAFMTFHISGRYARYFGMDRETNDLFTGGWSAGASKHKIWHAGNDGSGSGLDADLIDGLAFNNSNITNPITAPDSLNSNGIGYVQNISLYGQSDGALYSQAYSPVWQHQIYGDYRTGQIAIRGKNSNTWQSWRTVWDSGNAGSPSDYKRSNDQNQVNINSPASSSGSWTAASSDDEWGNPKFDGVYNEYRYADAPAWVQYNIPAGMKSAWISQLTWSSGGYVDVHGIQSGGQLVFLRRINTRQTVENTDEGVNHDGSTITFAASGLDDYSAIRFTVQSGRFHFTGLSFSTADNEGTEGVGMVHPAQISHQGSGSGLDADTVDGLNPTSANTASTIVARDGSGNFNAGTLGLTGINIDGANLNATNDATVYITATNNNDWGLVVNKFNSSATEYGQEIRVASGADYAFSILGSGTRNFRINGAGSVFSNGTVTATYFRDTDDTNYYGDFANAGLSLNLRGSANIGKGYTTSGADIGASIYYGSDSSGYGRIRFYENDVNTQTIHAFSANWGSGFPAQSRGAININGANGVTMGGWNVINSTGHWFDNSGNGQSSASFRSPVFYDSDNTTYQFDGTGTTRLNTLRIFTNPNADWDAIQITTDGESGYIQGLGDEIGLRIRSQNGNILLADDRGSVGIKNTSPLQALDVRGNFLLAADSTTATHITQKPYTINGGTLSWEGSAGQLFSITNNLTSGSIFSVNDVSGLPSIDVDANGTILLAPYGGNIGAGTLTPSQKLHVVGNSIITGSLGLGIDSALAKLHTRVSTPTSIGSLPSGVTGILDSSSNNYLLFRNSADNGTYSGIAMQDNNVGGYVIFGNAGGGGDLLYLAGYGGGQLQYGTADSINPSARTTVASWNSTGLQINSGDLRAPIYRDSDDPSNRYLDPSGTSELSVVKTRELIVNPDGSTSSATSGYLSFWSSNGTTSRAQFVRTDQLYGTHGAVTDQYAQYWLMDSNNRGWIFRHATTDTAGTNVFSIRNNDGTTTIGAGGFTPGNVYARLNIHTGSSSPTLFRDIDLRGGWSAGEGHAITATYGSSSTEIVGQMVFEHNSPGSRIKWGRLFHSGDQSTYPMHLISNGDQAYLRLSYNNATGLANETFNVAKTNLGGLHFANGSGPGGGAGRQTAITFMGDVEGEAQAGIYVHNNNSSGTAMALATTNSYATGPQIGLSISSTGYAYFPRSYVESTGSFRAPIFYDSNNTGLYVDPASTSILNTLRLTSNNALYFSTTSTAQFEHDSNSTPVAFAMIKSGTSFSDGDNYGVLNLRRLNHTDSIANAGASLFFELKDSGGTVREYAGITGRKTEAGAAGGQLDFHYYGRTVMANMNSSLFHHVGSVRAPIFYDSNDTSYYIDSSSTSNSASRIRGGALHGPNVTWGSYLLVGGDGRNGYIDSTTTASVCSTNGNLHIDAASGYETYINLYDGNKIIFGNGANGSWGEWSSGILYSYADTRSPIFYDYDNTAYYLNLDSTGNSVNIAGSLRAATYNKPAIVSVANGSASTGASFAIQQETVEGWTGIFVDFEPYTGWGLYHDNPNNYFCITSEDSTGSLRSFTVPSRVSGNRTAYEKIRFDQNDGSLIAGGEIRAPIFRDSNDPSNYYLNPASSSNLWYVQLDDRLSLIKNKGHFTGVESTSSADGRGQIILNSYYSDVVIASQQTNANHGSTLSFTAVNPSNSGDYRKFVINQGNWTGSHLLRFGWADGAYTNPHSYVTGTFGSGYDVLGLDGANRITYAFGDIRAPIFRDSDDPSNRYLDPSGTSVLNTVIATSFVNTDAGIRIHSPGGASYSTQTSLVTGAIKIRLPAAALGSNTMMSFRVSVYDYSTGSSQQFLISGYNYYDSPSYTWYNESAISLSDTGSRFTVRFGKDATSQCVYIGELTSTWNYPQVFVTDFCGGYSGATSAIWSSGWNISFESSAFAGVTKSRTAGFNADLLDGLNPSTSGTSNIVSRDASGNFSAGTITATLSGNATNVTGTVAVGNGGSGATTRKAASNSIANFGQLENHGTYTDANNVQQWGGTFIQASTNCPNFNGYTQHYQMMLSLGANYDWGGGNVYAMQMCIARNVTTPYIGIRYKEGGNDTANWGSWQKIAAGTADSCTGNAATATNISNTGTVTLASATESNSIYVSQPSYVTDQPVKLLNFDWYGNIWSLGNIRSGSTPSNGFGVYSSGTERARFTTSGLTVGGNVTASAFYGDGSNLTGITAGATLSASSGSQRIVLTSLTSGTMTSAATSSALTFDSSTGTLSSTIFTSTSDITKKTNIQNITNAVELIKQINGVKFDWKEAGESSAGVIAQEVEEVLPEIVHTNDEGIKSVNYNGVVGLLVEAIKEQQKQIDELKKELKKLHK